MFRQASSPSGIIALPFSSFPLPTETTFLPPHRQYFILRVPAKQNMPPPGPTCCSQKESGPKSFILLSGEDPAGDPGKKTFSSSGEGLLGRKGCPVSF